MPQEYDHNTYLRLLNLPGDIRVDLPQRKLDAIEKALNRAHQLRRFEIDNYWKRATYFWAFQAAAITFFAVMLNSVSDGTILDSVLLLPIGFGCLTALVGYMTARGSKFWQENWEMHVDALEQFIEGDLTKVILRNGDKGFSVSRVNQRLFLILFYCWLGMFLYLALGLTAFNFDKLEIGIFSILLLMLILTVQYFDMNSALKKPGATMTKRTPSIAVQHNNSLE